MVPNRPARGPRPHPIPSGALESAPERVFDGGEGIPGSRFSCIDEGDCYRLLLRTGVPPFEAVSAILREELHTAYRVALLAPLVSRTMPKECLKEVLARFSIHPLSLAVQYQDRRRALGILRKVDLLQRYGPWIGPGGRLLIQGNARLRRLPNALVIRGDTLIADCPRLVCLGAGLTSLFGRIRIERCALLRRLPERLETHYLGDVLVSDCPFFEGLGRGTQIRGQFKVIGCPRFGPSNEGAHHVDESISKN